MRKTWVLYSSLIPPSGSRIALPQDKQLEIAHVVIYCRIYSLITSEQGTIHPMWTFRLRTFWGQNLRDSTAEDNVRKRPFTTKVWPACPFGLLRVGYKDTTFFTNSQSFRQKFAQKVAELRKKHYICTRKQEDISDIVSESNDNRTRRHPVDLLAGHLFYR